MLSDGYVDWGLVERARQLAGLKGYVTDLPVDTMDGAAVPANRSLNSGTSQA